MCNVNGFMKWKTYQNAYTNFHKNFTIVSFVFLKTRLKATLTMGGLKSTLKTYLIIQHLYNSNNTTKSIGGPHNHICTNVTNNDLNYQNTKYIKIYMYTDFAMVAYLVMV